MTAPKHLHHDASNGSIKPHHGNTLSYTLDRLKREQDEGQHKLFDQVVAKQLSANAAAIQAGWRKQSTPLEQLCKAWAKASPAERREFLSRVAKPRR